jgi:hypothetical protein
MKKKPLPLPVVNASAETGGLGRREVLQGLLAGVGAAIPGTAAGAPEGVPAPAAKAAAARARAADWRPEFLDPHQLVTLQLLCEQIVPGSLKVQSDRFLDALLAVDSHENRQRFLSALGAIDGEAAARFGSPYKSLASGQQLEVLRAAAGGPPGWDWVWTPGTPVVPPDQAGRTTLRDHFDTLKGRIATAYYSSEAGLKELGHTGNHFYASFPDCDHEGGHSE